MQFLMKFNFDSLISEDLARAITLVLSSLLSLFIFNVSWAQVNFSEIPFTDALQRARSEGKIIFLQFEAANCNQCNDVANKGFENKELADKINKTFFCLVINAQHPDRNKIATAYNMNVDKSFGTLFIDNNGTVVHKFLKTTSFSKEYSDQVDIALMKAGENMFFRPPQRLNIMRIQFLSRFHRYP